MHVGGSQRSQTAAQPHFVGKKRRRHKSQQQNEKFLCTHCQSKKKQSALLKCDRCGTTVHAACLKQMCLTKCARVPFPCCSVCTVPLSGSCTVVQETLVDSVVVQQQQQQQQHCECSVYELHAAAYYYLHEVALSQCKHNDVRVFFCATLHPPHTHSVPVAFDLAWNVLSRLQVSAAASQMLLLTAHLGDYLVPAVRVTERICEQMRRLLVKIVAVAERRDDDLLSTWFRSLPATDDPLLLACFCHAMQPKCAETQKPVIKLLSLPDVDSEAVCVLLDDDRAVRRRVRLSSPKKTNLKAQALLSVTRAAHELGLTNKIMSYLFVDDPWKSIPVVACAFLYAHAHGTVWPQPTEPLQFETQLLAEIQNRATTLLRFDQRSSARLQHVTAAVCQFEPLSRAVLAADADTSSCFLSSVREHSHGLAMLNSICCSPEVTVQARRGEEDALDLPAQWSEVQCACEYDLVLRYRRHEEEDVSQTVLRRVKGCDVPHLLRRSTSSRAINAESCFLSTLLLQRSDLDAELCRLLDRVVYAVACHTLVLHKAAHGWPPRQSVLGKHLQDDGTN